MKVSAILSVVATVLLYCSAVIGQETGILREYNPHYDISILNTENGLPQNSVTDIYQDSLGYLWIATYGGLTRYDGLKTKNYDAANYPDLVNNRVTYIFPDQTGGLIIRLESNGWNFFYNNTFTYFDSIHTFYDYYKSKFAPDTNAIPLLSRSGIQFVESEEAIKQINKLHFDYYEHGYNVYKSPSDVLWILDREKKLHRVKDNILKSFDVTKEIDSNFIFMNMFEVNEKNLAFTTIANNVYIFDTYSFKLRKRLYKKKSLKLRDVHQDTDSTLYIIGEDIYRWNINSDTIETIFENGQSTAFEAIRMFADRENSIWIASNADGLIQLQPHTIFTYSEKDGLPSNLILSINELSRDSVFVGTNGGGLALVNPKKNDIKAITIKESPFIWSTFRDSKENYWISTYGAGLLRINSYGRTLFNSKDGLHSWRIRSLMEDSNNNLWIGTSDSGLFKYDYSNFAYYGREDGLLSRVIISMAEDASGNIWIGSNGEGVFRYDGNKFRQFSKEDGLMNDVIRALYPDEFGGLWVGTYGGGLSYIKGDSIRTLTKEDGLFDNIIHNIFEDEYGRFWMSSNRGIFYVLKSELYDFLAGKTKEIFYCSFGKKDGMLTEECNGGSQPSAMQASDGCIWYPTIKGVAIINPKLISGFAAPLQSVIEQVTIDDTLYETPKEIKVPFGVKNISIDYNAIKFVKPENIRYRYKLEGYEENWNYVGNRKTAYYTNVPPGEYRFVVNAANIYHRWETNEADFALTVKPAFWQTTWFLILVILFGILIVYLFIQLRFTRIKAQKQKLENEVKKRTFELAEANKHLTESEKQLKTLNATKDKFFSIIAHDLKNPFSVMHGFAEILLNEFRELTEQQKIEFIKSIDDSAMQGYKLLENLLEWSKAQTGAIGFNPEPQALQNLIQSNIVLLDNLALKKEIRLSTNIPVETLVLADEDMVNTIIRNLITNALKFTPKGGEVSISSVENGNDVTISVTDTGVGIPKDKINLLFKIDTSVSTVGTEQETGSGLGLILCKEFIEIHGGNIWVESVVEKGSAFHFTLPTVR